MKQTIDNVGLANSGLLQFVIDGSRYNKNLLTKENIAFVRKSCEDEGYQEIVNGRYVVQIVGYNGKSGGEVQKTFHVSVE